jgi:thiol-disulfide isomerase/thioredoxin
MSKKLKLLIISFCLFIFPINSVFAEDKVKIDLFWAIGCPHCEKERAFLDNLLEDEKYKNKIIINEYEISRNTDNSHLLREMADNIDVKVQGVPATFINEEVFISGFLNAEVTGLEIKTSIDKYYDEEINHPSDSENSENMDIPILGNVDLKSF